MDLVLTEMPSLGRAYVAALASGLRRPGTAPAVPQLVARVTQTRADAARLAAYCEICGFPQRDTLPITYPQVLAAPLQMHLLTRGGFPLPLLGLVHVRNDIEQQRPLSKDGSYAVSVATTGSREVPQGVEFDLVTEFLLSDSGAPNATPLWRATATVLHRIARPGEKRGRPKTIVSPLPFGEYLTLEAPTDIGRRYGRIAGDMNPIHLHPLSARLFGFRRHIAHGMWSLARCAALLEGRLEGRLDALPTRLQAQFRRPLFLPAKLALKYICDSGAANGAEVQFALVGKRSGDIHVMGSLR